MKTMNELLEDLIYQNFNNAAKRYNQSADIQKKTAIKLSKLCAINAIPSGLWVDLGSGTGLLADSLEKQHPHQYVMRIDKSEQMIEQHPLKRTKHVWDLNHGLPYLRNKPTLLASSFALHWLHNPNKCLHQWFHSLAPNGWIALALPIKGSFKEWHYASKKAGVVCTAIHLPSTKVILNGLNTTSIRYNEIEIIEQKASNVISLLQPMVKVGAQTSMKKSLSVSEWKQLIKQWPPSKKAASFTLTWLIQFLLIQK